MTTDPAGLAEPEPAIRSLPAHLAGVENSARGTTLWLSDERTTMHFPLTALTVPALLGQLQQVAAEADAEDEPAAVPEPDPERGVPVDEEPGTLSRWTGWHYSNALVHRIPARQRIALFVAVLLILLLITLITR